jgi:hypothetical protein
MRQQCPDAPTSQRATRRYLDEFPVHAEFDWDVDQYDISPLPRAPSIPSRKVSFAFSQRLASYSVQGRPPAFRWIPRWSHSIVPNRARFGRSYAGKADRQSGFISPGTFEQFLAAARPGQWEPNWQQRLFTINRLADRSGQCVANLGVAGYGAMQELRVLKGDALAKSPK